MGEITSKTKIFSPETWEHLSLAIQTAKRGTAFSDIIADVRRDLLVCPLTPEILQDLETLKGL